MVSDSNSGIERDNGSVGASKALQNPDPPVPVALITIGILFFLDFLFSDKNLFFRDILNFHYPLRRVLIDSYTRWQFPLWNPYIYLGQPMLANPNYMAFYPTNLFHLFWSFNYAFKLHFVIHPLLAGPGLYFLQRRLGILPLAAFGGALVYEFSGAVLSFLNVYNIVPAVALVPWIAWSFLRALERRSGPRLVTLGILIALQIVAFEPLMVQCSILLLAGLSILHILTAENRRQGLRSVIQVGFASGLFGVGVAAVQVLPALELMPYTVRGTGYAATLVSWWSMHPMDLVNFLVPRFFGDSYTMTASLYWGEGFHFGREGYIVSYFIGGGTLLLAVLSFWSAQKRLRSVLLGLACISLILALGQFTPAYYWLGKIIPIFRLGRFPSKFALLLTLSLAILAALGLEVVLKLREEQKRRRAVLVGPVLLALAIAILCLGLWLYLQINPQILADRIRSLLEPTMAPFKDVKGITAQMTASLKWTGTFALIFAGLLLLAGFRKRTPLPASLLILALGAEILPQNLRLTPLMSGADVDFVSEVTTHLGQRSAEVVHRVMHLDSAMHVAVHRLKVPNLSVAWYSLLNRRTGQPFFGIMNGVQYALFVPIDDLNTTESNNLLEAYKRLQGEDGLALLKKVNCMRVLTQGQIDSERVRLEASFETSSDMPVRVYRLEDILPRAYIATGVRRAASHANALDLVADPSFPARDTVVLEDPGPVSPAGHSSGEARLRDYQNQFVRYETSSAVPGYLVLLDSYFPGWTAKLDGKPVPILRANYAFRAVEIPQGIHTVEFQYKPLSFYAGLTISLVSIVCGLLVAALNLRRRRG